MLFTKLLVLYVFLMRNSSNAARILGFFPVPSISHQVVFRQLTYELAKKGHTLVVITPDPAFHQDEVSKNITEINVHNSSYSIWRKEFVPNMNGKSTLYEILKIILRVCSNIVEMDLQNKEVQEMINRREQFDLILIEASIRPALIISHIFKAPVIQVSSFGSLYPNLNVIGAPVDPILYPEMFSHRIHNLTVLDKLYNIWCDIKIRYLFQQAETKENAMFKRILGKNAPSVDKLQNNIQMLFLNTYPLWDGNRPVPPGVVYIGGIYERPQQSIPKDIEQFLNSSTDGVIYMSLGTNINPSLLPSTVIQTLFNVFRKLPYDILLKWDTDEVLEKPKNVKLFKWLPQPDVLKHPKVTLFINQGGLQSTEEAISAGVPVIAFPVLADQWYNAEKYVHFNIGLKLDIQTITEKVFKNSITTVIKNQSYRNNIKKLRLVMLDQPESPAQRAVWWVEHLLRHGGARHLRTPLADVSWSEYIMWDVVTILFVTFIISLIILCYVFLVIIRAIGKINIKSKKNKSKTY